MAAVVKMMVLIAAVAMVVVAAGAAVLLKPLLSFGLLRLPPSLTIRLKRQLNI